MPHSGQSSRSTSSSSGKVPLQCQSGSKQSSTYDSYDPRYISPLSDPRYASSSKSSSSKSSRSSRADKIPLSISSGSSSRDEARSKTIDPRYYPTSFQDSRQPEKKPLSFQKSNDARYYENSSYYR